MCKSRDGSAPQSRVRIHRSRWFCSAGRSEWRSLGEPEITARSRAVTLLEPETRQGTKDVGRRWLLFHPSGKLTQQDRRHRSSKKGTRIPQNERDSLPPSTYPPHTPRNDRIRVYRRSVATPHGGDVLQRPQVPGRHPRLPPRRANGQKRYHRPYFPPWRCGLTGLQQAARSARPYSSLRKRSLTTGASHP